MPHPVLSAPITRCQVCNHNVAILAIHNIVPEFWHCQFVSHKSRATAVRICTECEFLTLANNHKGKMNALLFLPRTLQSWYISPNVSKGFALDVVFDDEISRRFLPLLNFLFIQTPPVVRTMVQKIKRGETFSKRFLYGFSSSFRYVHEKYTCARHSFCFTTH